MLVNQAKCIPILWLTLFFDGRLTLQELIEKSEFILNKDNLSGDFWYYLLWKFILYKDGVVNDAVLIEKLNEANYNLYDAFISYNTQMNSRRIAQQTFKELVDSIEVNNFTSVGAASITAYSKLYSPPFTLDVLFKVLFCKHKDISEKMYELLDEFVLYLRSDEAVSQSREVLFNELLEFTKRITGEYENMVA